MGGLSKLSSPPNHRSVDGHLCRCDSRWGGGAKSYCNCNPHLRGRHILGVLVTIWPWHPDKTSTNQKNKVKPKNSRNSTFFEKLKFPPYFCKTLSIFKISKSKMFTLVCHNFSRESQGGKIQTRILHIGWPYIGWPTGWPYTCRFEKSIVLLWLQVVVLILYSKYMTIWKFVVG